MSTANPDFFEVWQQVRHWPVELRQDLANKIIQSVESELPTTRDWSEAKNARRLELIDKDIQGTIDDVEVRELERLTREMRIHRRRVAPIPYKGAKQLHRRLLEAKQRYDESDDGE